MLRDWQKEKDLRVKWIQDVISRTHSRGVVIGLSGGKDSAIVAALCKAATPNVLGIALPCRSANPQDLEHAELLAKTFGIRFSKVPLDEAFDVIAEYVDFADSMDEETNGSHDKDQAKANIKPRLRMTTLYAIARLKNYLVAGTGNLSEATMGYYTKWGDGAHDFNPIADLTVTELFEFGRFLGIPSEILDKAPSAGLWLGQTDEQEMGISYAIIDKYLLAGVGMADDIDKIETAYERNAHKRSMPLTYYNDEYDL